MSAFHSWPLQLACNAVAGPGPSPRSALLRLVTPSKAAAPYSRQSERALHTARHHRSRSIQPCSATAPSTSRRHFIRWSERDAGPSSSVPSKPERTTPPASPADGGRRNPAFAFDIDGVLKKGRIVLQETYRALDILDGKNKRGEKRPYIFITNGGGVSEEQRAEILSKEFKRKIEPGQVVQAHTVLQVLLERFGKKDILVIGGPERRGQMAARSVMKSYGFDKAHTVQDIMHWRESVWPFRKLDAQEQEVANPRKLDFSKIRFSAVLVFHDSRDWGRDIQLACDVLRSPEGIIGNLGDDTHKQPYMAFSHGDLIWGTDFPTPRFGQGAFQIALRSVYKAASGRPLVAQTFGKPEPLTYEYANDLLQRRASMLSPDVGDLRVWMIGDNPASDIMGANVYGWESALVRTGVYRDYEGPPAHEPRVIVDNVEEAVRHALEKEWGPDSV